MGGINVNHDDMPSIKKSITSEWVTKDFLVPIEDIASDLRSQYSETEIQDLEVDFIGYGIRDNHPGTMLPAKFLDKIGCVIALVNNPYEYTADIFGFMNVVMVCNDIPQSKDEFSVVPSRYIVRALTAVNKITKPEFNMDDVYLHNNIQNYIFSCYIKDSNYILDGRLSSYNMDFLNKSVLPSKTVTKLVEIRPMLKEIKNVISKSKREITKILSGAATTDNTIYEMLLSISDQEFSEFMKENLKKYILGCVYDTHYKTILEQS